MDAMNKIREKVMAEIIAAEQAEAVQAAEARAADALAKLEKVKNPAAHIRKGAILRTHEKLETSLRTGTVFHVSFFIC